jgi:hypothetical protein
VENTYLKRFFARPSFRSLAHQKIMKLRKSIPQESVPGKVKKMRRVMVEIKELVMKL